MKIKSFVAIIVLIALPVLLAACANGEAATAPETGLQETTPAVPAAMPAVAEPTAPAAASAASRAEETAPASPTGTQEQPVAVEEPDARSEGPVTAISLPMPPTAPEPVSPSSVQISSPVYSAPLLQVASSQAGIWVTGEGTIALEPDLALLNIGVETEATTVAAARQQAANAMTAIVEAVKAHGLADRDIQTRSFSIYPRYDYLERTQVLAGYRVSNSVTIKIRDIDGIGVIIDDVADAGGDATRINGISFTVEDPEPFITQLREAAVNDALAKAQHFATLAGVSLGRLVYISETGTGSPVSRDFGGAVMEMAAPSAAPTPVSVGELELSMTVQAAFDIQ